MQEFDLLDLILEKYTTPLLDISNVNIDDIYRHESRVYITSKVFIDIIQVCYIYSNQLDLFMRIRRNDNLALDENCSFNKKFYKISKNLKEISKEFKLEDDTLSSLIFYDFKKMKDVHKKNMNKTVGRKNKFKDKDIKRMKDCRNEGKSYREIASIFNCSVGLVHKLLNKNKRS